MVGILLSFLLERHIFMGHVSFREGIFLIYTVHRHCDTTVVRFIHLALFFCVKHLGNHLFLRRV